MALITGTKALVTELGGRHRILKLTCTLTSASDTITLTAATHGMTTILFVIPKLTAGFDAALTNVFATYSGSTITILTTAAAGTAATDWTGATCEVLVIGY
jgi:hypothetical protein